MSDTLLAEETYDTAGDIFQAKQTFEIVRFPVLYLTRSK